MPKAMRHATMPSHASTNVRSFRPGGGAEIPKMKWSPRNIFARNWIMAPLRRCAAMTAAQYDIGPTSFSTSAVSTMTMASHGQPSRKQPSGPLLRHFLQPMHWMGSIWMRPNGGLSSSGTQNMQSSTGQYSTHAGDPAQPVQHSVITASSLGFFLRAVVMPFERGSNFCSSGTIPGAFTTSGALVISGDFTLSVKPLPARFLPHVFPPVAACYNARAVGFVSSRTHVYQKDFRQASRARFAGRTRFAPLFHLALPLLFRQYGLLRRAGPQLAVPRRLRLLLARATGCLGCARSRLSGISRRDLFSGGHGPDGRHASASVRRSCDVRVGGGHRPSSGHRRARPCAYPCRSGSALAHRALSLHGELCGRAAHGSLGDIFHYACALDFSVAGGDGVRPHHLQTRSSSQYKNLVRGRTRGWPRNARSARNAVASRSRSDFPVASLSPPRILEQTCTRNAVDDRWSAAAAGAVGRAQCRESRARAVSRAALRRNVRRRFADRLLCLDENVDVPFSRRLSLHLEIVVAANRREESSFVRRGFSRGIIARRFPAGPLQPRARHTALTRSGICRVGTRTREATSDSHLCLDPHRARRRNVVHSADYAAAFFRPLLAAGGKLPLQSRRV